MSSEHLEPPLASLTFTHVYYNPDDPVSLVSAWLALVPQAIIISYVALIWGQREIELLMMFAGQLVCEALNWVLKRTLKEERPEKTHGKGYGMPSSHAQFVAFFSVYITLWMFLRNRHLTPAYRYGLSTLALTAAICISLSRVYLSYHTPKQVLAGTSVGVLLGITWYLFTGFVRSTPLRFAGRRVWEWVMWFGGFLWAKDMCLDVDLVEHDWNVWNSRVNGVSGNSKVKVR